MGVTRRRNRSALRELTAVNISYFLKTVNSFPKIRPRPAAPQMLK
jgi:hypothetical protein